MPEKKEKKSEKNTSYMKDTDAMMCEWAEHRGFVCPSPCGRKVEMPSIEVEIRKRVRGLEGNCVCTEYYVKLNISGQGDIECPACNTGYKIIMPNELVICREYHPPIQQDNALYVQMPPIGSSDLEGLKKAAREHSKSIGVKRKKS
jgi:hypothetical protein